MKSTDEANDFRIPSAKDRVRLRGLVSSNHLNGEMGVVLRHVLEQDRYQVKLLAAKNSSTTFAVKRNNLELVLDEDTTSSSPHVLIPCHLNDEHRLEQFMQCAKSVAKQTDTCACAFVGISSPHAALRAHAEAILRILNNKRPGVRWYVINHNFDQRSQFEHLDDLLKVSDAVNPEAWLMFLDNDDMFHPRRVECFRSFLTRILTTDPDEVAFNCGNKLLLDSDIIDYNKVELDEFVLEDGAKEPWRDDKALLQVTQLAMGNDVERLNAIEYFDFCVRASFLRRYIELTPSEILSNKYCDVRFLASLTRNCTKRLNPPIWLIAHFKLRQRKKTSAFWEADAERHERHASTRVSTITDEDRTLVDQTGLSAEQIAMCRNEIEEQAIMFIARDEGNLERAREHKALEINENCGHNLGSTLWEQTCQRFLSYFSEELVTENKDWCDSGRAPYVLLNFDEDGDELY